MNASGPVTGLVVPRPTSESDRLWQAAHDLEGVFLAQLFQAMRSTVPQGEGFLASSSSEDIFSAMLDEMLGKFAAERLEGGMGDALYRQLSRRISTPEQPTVKE